MRLTVLPLVGMLLLPACVAQPLISDPPGKDAPWRKRAQATYGSPLAMNRFIDGHGVRDLDHERAARDDPRFAAVLLPGRQPTRLAGRALVIIDSRLPEP